MDAAERAELDALRRRAYGPRPDIDDDPEALARLIELEELARPVVPAPAPVRAAGDSAPAADPRPAEPAVPAPAAAPAPRSRRPSILRTATAVAAAIVVTIIVMTALQKTSDGDSAGASPSPSATSEDRIDSAWVYAGDPDAERLMTIQLDASYTNYVAWPTDRPIPEFPSENQLKWATPIGRYYGWSLWVAGGGDFPVTEHCILIERGSVVRARCLDGRRQAAGGLRVSIGQSDVPRGELPAELAADQRIRFWWLRDGNVDVVLGRFDPE